jgi:hypothetical protein
MGLQPWASIKAHATIKLSNLMGWDGVGEIQRLRGRWTNNVGREHRKLSKMINLWFGMVGI